MKSGDYYTCKWTNVEFSIAATQTVTITITASDDFGNTATETITKTFQVDTTAPVITALRTDFVYEDRNYMGDIPVNLTAEITEGVLYLILQGFSGIFSTDIFC